MRSPKLGEILKCVACGEDCKRIDHKWIEFFNTQSDEDQQGMYNEENDCFLSYDGCQSKDSLDEPPGLTEEQRSYLRGSSYRPL